MGGRKGALEPFLQGELDGLCGPYAIINGIRLALGLERQMPDAVWVDMFGGMLREVSKRHSRGDLCAAGLETQHLMTALRWALKTMEREQGIQVKYHRPFVNAGRPRIPQVLDGLRRYQELPNTSIILGIGGPLDHWTVIRNVGDHYIRFFDSSGCHGIRIDRCRMGYEPRLGTTTEHLLYVGSAIALSGRSESRDMISG